MCCSEICEIKCTAGCEHYLGKSLFFMGEFGGNDVFLLAANKTVDETKVYSISPKINTILRLDT